jgi:hypothetical protein
LIKKSVERIQDGTKAPKSQRAEEVIPFDDDYGKVGGTEGF